MAFVTDPIGIKGEEEAAQMLQAKGYTILAHNWRLGHYEIDLIAERQRNVSTRIYAYIVAGIFLFHLMVNVGMVLGLLPVIGIPLPFFSYGGSSLWVFTLMLFILLRLDAARTEEMR